MALWRDSEIVNADEKWTNHKGETEIRVPTRITTHQGYHTHAQKKLAAEKDKEDELIPPWKEEKEIRQRQRTRSGDSWQVPERVAFDSGMFQKSSQSALWNTSRKTHHT